MAEDETSKSADPNEDDAARQTAENPHEGLVALEGVVYVDVSQDGIMDDDLFEAFSEEEQQAPASHNPFENLQAVEGAVSILGRHDGVMDDDMLDITIERSGWGKGQDG